MLLCVVIFRTSVEGVEYEELGLNVVLCVGNVIASELFSKQVPNCVLGCSLLKCAF